MSAYISVSLQQKVREHFANCCAYCRTAESLTVTTFEIEHIIPRSAGGPTAFENLCLACPICNRHKFDQVAAADPDSGVEVALFDPQRQRWPDHFEWDGRFSRLLGLTATGRATVDALRMNRRQMIRIRQLWVTMSEHPPDIDS